VIDGSGYIITNHHIIESSVDPKYEGYSKVFVIPGDDDNVRFTAKIVGYDPIYDLALIKIENNMESFIRFGDSNVIRQGQKVLAIGNPVGLTNTVTSGVVSSLDRPFLQIGNIIQIDAALNPGNSGGALINDQGYLVGVAFAGLESFENLNFAIPSNLLLSQLFRLYQGGEVERSWAGLAVEKRGEDLIVDYIVPEGPGRPSRLLKGDVIQAVNQKPVHEINDIQALISYYNSPIIINLTVERDNKSESKNILLKKRPQTPAVYIYNHDAHENIITPLFGIVATRVDPRRKKSYLVSRIVAGSIANSVGITEGDLIKMKTVKYDEENRYFYLPIELKSKRFGYINKSITLYSPADINIFI
jgi:S1-C subfamily serine protease